MKNIFMLLLLGMTSVAMAEGAIKQFAQDQMKIIKDTANQVKDAGQGIAADALHQATEAGKDLTNQAQQAASSFIVSEGQEVKDIESYRLKQAEMNQMNIANQAIQAAQAGGIQKAKEVLRDQEKAALSNEISTQKNIAAGVTQQANIAAGDFIARVTPSVQATAQSIAQNASDQAKAAGQQIIQNASAAEQQLIHAEGKAVAQEALQKAKDIAQKIIPHG